jgi:hypothetical protein
MEILTYDFIREARDFSILNIQQPNIIYSLVNPIGQNLKIEFIADINCSIIKDNEVIFFCGPPKKKMSSGEINITDRNSMKIGYVDYWGMTFKKKRIIIDYSKIHEEWILKKDSFSFRNFWKSNLNNTVLVNGKDLISLIAENTNMKSKKIQIRIPSNINDDFSLMCGLIIYMHELREFEMR